MPRSLRAYTVKALYARVHVDVTLISNLFMSRASLSLTLVTLTHQPTGSNTYSLILYIVSYSGICFFVKLIVSMK